jgi:DNA-binding IclR family transcriptional regulator
VAHGRRARARGGGLLSEAALPTARPAEASRALDRGLRLLEALAAAPGGLSVTELAAAIGTSRPVVYRLLEPLRARRLVRRVGDRYRLGLGLLELAGRVAPGLAAAAEPHLRDLADALGATAHLTLLDGEDAVVAAVVEPREAALHVAYRVGLRHPASVGAAGLAILAGRPAQPGERAEVAAARVRGYAVSRGELQPGAHGFAAPVTLAGRPAEASIGLVALAPLDEAATAPPLLAAAGALAAEAG